MLTNTKIGQTVCAGRVLMLINPANTFPAGTVIQLLSLSACYAERRACSLHTQHACTPTDQRDAEQNVNEVTSALECVPKSRHTDCEAAHQQELQRTPPKIKPMTPRPQSQPLLSESSGMSAPLKPNPMSTTADSMPPSKSPWRSFCFSLSRT